MNIKPQVGDVWGVSDSISNMRVTAVGDTCVLGYNIKRNPAYEGTWCFEQLMTLIERDGVILTVREFKEGAFYPAMFRGVTVGGRVGEINFGEKLQSCSIIVVRYHANKNCFLWQGRALIESDFSWIGEEIKIDWPEVGE